MTWFKIHILLLYFLRDVNYCCSNLQGVCIASYYCEINLVARFCICVLFCIIATVILISLLLPKLYFRKVYGYNVGPTRRNPKDASDKWYYHDVRRRDIPLPAKINDKISKSKLSSLPATPILSRAAEPANCGSSILKAQLSAPLRPISPATSRLVMRPQDQSVS